MQYVRQYLLAFLNIIIKNLHGKRTNEKTFLIGLLVMFIWNHYYIADLPSTTTIAFMYHRYAMIIQFILKCMKSTF